MPLFPSRLPCRGSRIDCCRRHACLRRIERQLVFLFARLLLSLALLGFAVNTSFAARAKHHSDKSASTTATLPSAKSPWEVVKIGSHDYLTARNVAEFYGLPSDPLTNNKTSLFENEKGSLQFTLGSREMLINGARNWLSFPVLEKDGQFLVSRLDLAETIEPQMRPQMIANIGHVKTVVLDPGHGGYDKGAVGRYGCEKDYTLDVARQLRPFLQARGFRVLMTREGDYFVPLDVRARIASAVPDSIFVSIHFNAADINPNASGFEIYSLTPRGAPSTQDDLMKANADNMQNGTPVDTHSIELSASIYHSLLGHVGEFDRGIKRARFAVLRQTKIPAVLIEGGFLTEGGESKLIASKDWRAKLAQAISVGIDNYKSLAENKLPPLLVRDYTRKEELTPGLKLQPVDTGTPAAPDLIPAPDSSSPARDENGNLIGSATGKAVPPAASPSAPKLDLTKAPIVP